MLRGVNTSNHRITRLAYAALAVVDAGLAVAGPKGRRARWATKPLLMPLLHLATRPDRSNATSRGIAAAQALSWGGDVALMNPGRSAFLTGVGSFAGAHAAYIATFGRHRDQNAEWTDGGPKAAGAVWLVAAPLLGTAAARQDRTLGVPVAGYAAIIAGMAATASMLDRRLPGRAQVMAGAALFMLSDSLIGVQRFLRSEPSPALEAAIMLTYTGGQWCIAEGINQPTGATH